MHVLLSAMPMSVAASRAVLVAGMVSAFAADHVRAPGAFLVAGICLARVGRHRHQARRGKRAAAGAVAARAGGVAVEIGQAASRPEWPAGRALISVKGQLGLSLPWKF